MQSMQFASFKVFFLAAFIAVGSVAHAETGTHVGRGTGTADGGTTGDGTGGGGREKIEPFDIITVPQFGELLDIAKKMPTTLDVERLPKPILGKDPLAPNIEAVKLDGANVPFEVWSTYFKKYRTSAGNDCSIDKSAKAFADTLLDPWAKMVRDILNPGKDTSELESKADEKTLRAFQLSFEEYFAAKLAKLRKTDPKAELDASDKKFMLFVQKTTLLLGGFKTAAQLKDVKLWTPEQSAEFHKAFPAEQMIAVTAIVSEGDEAAKKRAKLLQDRADRIKTLREKAADAIKLVDADGSRACAVKAEEPLKEDKTKPTAPPSEKPEKPVDAKDKKKPFDDKKPVPPPGDEVPGNGGATATATANGPGVGPGVGNAVGGGTGVGIGNDPQFPVEQPPQAGNINDLLAALDKGKDRAADEFKRIIDALQAGQQAIAAQLANALQGQNQKDVQQGDKLNVQPPEQQNDDEEDQPQFASPLSAAAPSDEGDDSEFEPVQPAEPLAAAAPTPPPFIVLPQSGISSAAAPVPVPVLRDEPLPIVIPPVDPRGSAVYEFLNGNRFAQMLSMIQAQNPVLGAVAKAAVAAGNTVRDRVSSIRRAPGRVSGTSTGSPSRYGTTTRSARKR